MSAQGPDPKYLLAAVEVESGITDLGEIAE